MHELNFDYEAFYPRLLDATRQALTWEKVQHAGETFYAFGIYGSAGWGYIVPFCCTEEALTRVAESYLERSGTTLYRGMTLKDMRLDLRFSLADSPYARVFENVPYKRLFESINHITTNRQNVLFEMWDTVYEQQGEDEAQAIIEPENERFTHVCHRVLKQLDAEGLFGRGAAREAVTVIATDGDQDLDLSTFGDAIRDLNPPSVYEDYLVFRRAWLALLERRQAQQRQRRSGNQ